MCYKSCRESHTSSVGRTSISFFSSDVFLEKHRILFKPSVLCFKLLVWPRGPDVTFELIWEAVYTYESSFR